MIGLSELIIPLVIFLVVLIFGPKTISNAYRKWKGVKKDISEIDNEFEQANKLAKKELSELPEIK